jgi:hypothetical protein
MCTIDSTIEERKENKVVGQYWYCVNLDKKEFIHPHYLGAGLKLWEQVANHPGTGTALIILLAAMPEQRGGGDLDLDANWHGPEQKSPEHNLQPAPMPKEYHEVALLTIGRWAGDRVALVGDYADDGDLPAEFEASKIYGKCSDGEYMDITQYVAAVIEHELNGKYEGDG